MFYRGVKPARGQLYSSPFRSRRHPQCALRHIAVQLSPHNCTKDALSRIEITTSVAADVVVNLTYVSAALAITSRRSDVEQLVLSVVIHDKVICSEADALSDDLGITMLRLRQAAAARLARLR